MNLPEVLIAKCLSCLDSMQIFENLKTSKNMRTIFKKYSWMIPLDFNYMKTITDADMEYLEGAHTIDLGHTKITDEGLAYFKNVKKINLCGCNKITGEGFKYLKNALVVNICSLRIKENSLKYLTSVHTIDLYLTKGITSEELKHLKNVKVIDFAHTEMRGLNYTHLEAVEVLGISEINREAISKLKKLRAIHYWKQNMSKEDKEYLEMAKIKLLTYGEFMDMLKVV